MAAALAMKDEGEGGTVGALRGWLAAQFGARARFGEPLARHTSFRIGGPADAWVELESEDELAVLVGRARADGIALTILGGGTNVLVSDRGVRGVVLHLGRAFHAVEWDTDGAAARVRAGAAMPFKKLVYDAVGRGFAGLEFGEGIPGSLGGGLVMNAGAFGGEISRVVEVLEGVNGEGHLVALPRARLDFRYRRLDLPPAFLITAVRLRLDRGDRAEMEARVTAARARRKAHQPLGFPNAGSVFKNPPGAFAGKLLEDAGCKGISTGGAQVSEQHANFIVNRGGATAADVRRLMDEMRLRVLQRAGIRLEAEVKLVGDWSEQ